MVINFLSIHSNIQKCAEGGLIKTKICFTSDYDSPGYAGLRYMAHWRFWRFLPFWRLFANLAILATFWRFFWLILILGQFVITPYSDIF